MRFKRREVQKNEENYSLKWYEKVSNFEKSETNLESYMPNRSQKN